MKSSENVAEFITGSRMATLTFTETKWINRLTKLYAERPEDFEYFYENEDGSICCKVPKKWFKINPGSKSDAPKRVLSEEQKAKMQEKLKAYREEKAKENGGKE